MVGVRRYNNTSEASIKPYFIFNDWIWRKRTEKGNADYGTNEVGDIVVQGVLPDGTSFQGEWLGDISGNGINDLSNYNSPGDFQLNP